jgi:sec-independent protein translocase protein TatB
MFDIAWGELLVIGLVALVVIGPKELPGALRALGQWTGKLRRMASEFQNQFQEAMREAEMADLKKQVDEMASQAQSYANFDPVGEVRRELDSTKHEIEKAIAEPPKIEASSSIGAREEDKIDEASRGVAVPTDAAVATAAPSPAPTRSEPASQDAGREPA